MSSSPSSSPAPPDSRRSPAVSSIHLVEEPQSFGIAARACALTPQRIDFVERISAIPPTRRKEDQIRRRRPRRPEESSAAAATISNPEGNSTAGKTCRLPFARRIDRAKHQNANLRRSPYPDAASISPPPPSVEAP
ncbi:hypothetical protein C2845_PM17G13230 [Panicum miliaceum]|uniref:Uncharacterized protein n=1 Tax=Panicum miliaceum TaxID=4540 RepID=A0A3L6Q200_PANMI|nr:hypothetical protein C2845_PM17G13230 [Panicum miliaceum]